MDQILGELAGSREDHSKIIPMLVCMYACITLIVRRLHSFQCSAAEWHSGLGTTPLESRTDPPVQCIDLKLTGRIITNLDWRLSVSAPQVPLHRIRPALPWVRPRPRRAARADLARNRQAPLEYPSSSRAFRRAAIKPWSAPRCAKGRVSTRRVPVEHSS